MNRKPANLIIVDGDLAFVHLTRGHIATVDASSVDMVRRKRWRSLVDRHPDGSVRNVYAVSNTPEPDGKRGTYLLHRLLAGAIKGVYVDHRDGDGLNNRNGNLRTCTNTENGRNQRVHLDSQTGYKGVFFRGEGQRWGSQIIVGGRRRHLGCFDTPAQAAAAYDVAALKLFGEFARLNGDRAA